MTTIDQLPRLADRGVLGVFGKDTRSRLELQTELARSPHPLHRGRILHMPVVMPARPEAAHEVLVTKARSFEKSPGFRVLLRELAGEGVFTSEGALWRAQRKLMSPLFQPQPLARYATMMRAVAERAAAGLAPGQTVDVAHLTTRIAMGVVGVTLFDVDTFDEADVLGTALTTCLDFVNRNLASPALGAHVLLHDVTLALSRTTNPRVRALAERANEAVGYPFLLPGIRDTELRAAVRTIDERIQAMIDDRRRSPVQRNDLLTLLLAARDPEDPSRAMSDRQLRDEAVTLFVAGHETTATALAWSLYLLARHPEVLERARAEADAFGEGPIERWEPQRLDLCTRVFEEAMRLYPPIMLFPRRTLEEVEIAGCRLPPRTLTFVSAVAQHRRADVWPEPDRFDPDRFLAGRERTRPKGSYLPFSTGPRVCLGQHFAMMEGPIVLATLLRRWRFDVDPHRTVEEDDFATLRPRGGVPAVVQPR